MNRDGDVMPPLRAGRSVAAELVGRLCRATFPRFLLTGGLNTAVGYGLFLLALAMNSRIVFRRFA